MPGWIVQEDGPLSGTCTKGLLNATPSLGGENAAWVQTLILRWPLAAKIRFGRAAVRPDPPVEGTADPVVVQEPAGGNDFGLDGKITRPFHLAEIR
jgi:hypothetical protein